MPTDTRRNTHGRFLKLYSSILFDPELACEAAGVAWTYATIGLMAREAGTAGVVDVVQLRMLASQRPDADQLDGYLARLVDIAKITRVGGLVSIPLEVWERYNGADADAEQGRNRYQMAAHRRHHVRDGKVKSSCTWCVEEGLAPPPEPVGDAAPMHAPMHAPGCACVACATHPTHHDASDRMDLASEPDPPPRPAQTALPLVGAGADAGDALHCDARATHLEEKRREEKRREEGRSRAPTGATEHATTHASPAPDGAGAPRRRGVRHCPPKTLNAEGLERWNGTSSALAAELIAAINAHHEPGVPLTVTPTAVDDIDKLTRVANYDPESIGRLVRWLFGSEDEPAHFWRRQVQSAAGFAAKYDRIRADARACWERRQGATAAPGAAAGPDGWSRAWTAVQRHLSAADPALAVMGDDTLPMRTRLAAFVARTPHSGAVDQWRFRDAWLDDRPADELALPAPARDALGLADDPPEALAS